MYIETFVPGTMFSRLFHDSPVAMIITSLEDGRCIDANEAFAELVGRPRSEIIGAANPGLFTIIPSSSNTTTPTSDSADPDRISQFITADGFVRDVIISTQYEEWKGEKMQIMMVQSLTRFQRTHNALRNSEARLRIFFECIPIPLFVFDVETTNILDANNRASEHYGYSHEELLSMTMLDIRPPEERQEFIDTINNLTDDMVHVGTRIHQKRDGTKFIVDVTSYMLELDGQRARIGVLQDVTEKLTLQESLRESEARLKAITEMTSDVIWDYDLATGMVSYTNGLSTLYGYEGLDSTPIEWWTQHLHPEDRETTMETFNRALVDGDSFWEAQYRFRRYDGQYVYVLDRGYILRDEAGWAVRLIGSMVDITHQVELQEAANQAALNERRRLARDLHDTITQSLYSLSLMAEAARRRATEGDRQATYEYILRIGELAQQSLKEMRLLIYEFQPLALEDAGLIEAVDARLDAVERRSGIQARFNATLDQELSPVIQAQLFRVVEEALNNALKHSSASDVHVRIQVTGGSAEVEIRDNGRGFDPSEATSSAGLGLVSIKERIDKLGGSLDIISEPGKGAVIRVNLDLQEDNHGKHDSDLNL